MSRSSTKEIPLDDSQDYIQQSCLDEFLPGVLRGSSSEARARKKYTYLL
jgi:hypothetical protein